MKKKTWAIVLSAVLVLALAITGTFAWLTDRDSDVNVFTWGNVDITLNEEFEQGATLIPGKDIEKDVTVSNVGKSDAWVWVKIAMPAILDNDDASKNVIHFNYAADSVSDGQWNWKQNGTWNVAKNVVIDGKAYNVYTVLYDSVLTPGNTTAYSAMTKVYLDTAVDIDPEGNLHKVVGGNSTAVGWNIDTDGLPVIYVSAYGTQAEGFDTCAEAYAAYQTQWGNAGDAVEAPTVVKEVANADQLQAAIDNATNGDVIAFTADISGDVQVTQKDNVNFTIDGKGRYLNGVMTVFGNGRKLTAGLTVKNINFVAAEGASSCIVSPDRTVNNLYSYSTNVTVEGCTFTDYDGVVDCAAIRHEDGGDSNWKIIDCSVDNTMHSLVQVNNVEKDGLLVQGCTVNSKNGINLNQCTKVSVVDCEFDVLGYAVRYGVAGATVNGTFEIKDSTLKSANDDNDAVIICRGNMAGSTLTITDTVINGTPEITGNANVVR